jgi:hypothetical protein
MCSSCAKGLSAAFRYQVGQSFLFALKAFSEDFVGESQQPHQTILNSLTLDLIFVCRQVIGRTCRVARFFLTQFTKMAQNIPNDHKIYQHFSF